ncbi:MULTISPECIES: flagellar basal body rod protein FlgB [Caballeronia]|jgi:flagellar basal-body rod protein FlgB|uniref:Flagellar basal body rod protein FlgB n=1 Tax=Caballeronia zhejiangensis TaxID=871203 RepID=A0A656Q806_9BURK|nr:MULTISPECIES: flagellar basal body rod protein FlgB [Caballeronia]EKS69267.1 flagellar basal body rod protein FlgB [Burkholderia sp. SJ98]KDR24785.1 flagellar basal body rod protein FlgB [Caballeronia zhejiangensis]MCG7405058.1 flagellar basal body rod protein FlgB [Caballeronia zhejiangensis]MCI1041603.1 flagellar basal body rod protein FlgB [Caballeronia zhejiangensis]MDR5763666.1 flagellar basal body rod protein FlgB [Caballeronia sp. LZ028]
MLDRLDKEFAFGREALDVRAYRQELLSSNIANADTPGYKARDVDFSSALAGALKQGGSASNGSTLKMAQPVRVSTSGGMATTAKGHMSGTSTLSASGGPSDDYGKLAYRVPSQPSLDGNTVDLDSERVQFADNALHFEAGMTVLSSQIKSMLSAITSNS